ncbi:MAG TPA: hypothetical protein VK470_15790 [Bacteroidota bacterium]|nr:hypothetical protein [Bacteroidota bacterium]
MNTILEFLKIAGLATFHQLFGTLGVFLFFGLVLFVLSKITRNAFHNAGFPALDLYVTGWIGTPVHELSHAVFCIVFRHKITDMKLYSPTGTDGSLGYVRHTYDSKSLYQQAGNFFIGAGPVIAGTYVLYLLLMYLLPNRHEITGLMSGNAMGHLTASNLPADGRSIWSFASTLTTVVFSTENFSSGAFWLFLYLSVSIASHMGLSPSDVKGMSAGLLTILLIVFLVNCGAALMHTELNRYVMKANTWSDGFVCLFVWAAVIALINFIVSYMLLGIIFFLRKKSVLSILS